MIYLCVTENGYCHIVFASRILAIKWCDKHPQYHVVERILYRFMVDQKIKRLRAVLILSLRLSFSLFNIECKLNRVSLQAIRYPLRQTVATVLILSLIHIRFIRHTLMNHFAVTGSSVWTYFFACEATIPGLINATASSIETFAPEAQLRITVRKFLRTSSSQDGSTNSAIGSLAVV